jgi:hypothetical protein
MSSDRRVRRLFTLLTAVAPLLAAPRTATSNEDALTSTQPPVNEPCILLRNGNVLSGQIVRRGEDFTVMKNGATLHLAAHQVEAVCENLDSAYAHRRGALDPHDAVTHLKLAEWCIKQGLLELAEDEIDHARRVEPQHPRLSIVQSRLAVARQPARPSAPFAGPNTALASADVVGTGPANANFAAGGQPIRAPFADFPEDTLEQFCRGIQPLLLNTCTTSGCHSAGGEYSFVLDRGALWNDAPRDLTIANLEAVLDRLRRDSPLESPLVTAATTPHARPLSRPPIEVESAAFERLKAWVLHTTGHDKPQVEPVEDVEDGARAADADEMEEVEISEEELDALLFGDELNQRRVGSKIQRGLRPVARDSTDPYDPDEFNHRYSGKLQRP